MANRYLASRYRPYLGTRELIEAINPQMSHVLLARGAKSRVDIAVLVSFKQFERSFVFT